MLWKVHLSTSFLKFQRLMVCLAEAFIDMRAIPNSYFHKVFYLIPRRMKSSWEQIYGHWHFSIVRSECKHVYVNWFKYTLQEKPLMRLEPKDIRNMKWSVLNIVCFFHKRIVAILFFPLKYTYKVFHCVILCGCGFLLICFTFQPWLEVVNTIC